MNFETTEVNGDKLYSRKHTSVMVWNVDFPVDINEVWPIGEVVIIPAKIDSLTTNIANQKYLLIGLEYGASYWIKESDHRLLAKKPHELTDQELIDRTDQLLLKKKENA